MSGVDWSKWNQEGAPPGATFVLIQTSFDHSEEPGWRDEYNKVVALGLGVGFYHFAGPADPVGQAHLFAGLVQTIPHTYGEWLDAETNQNEHFVDQFRAVRDTGVYSSADGFANAMHHVYDRFERNWIAWPNAGGPPVRWLLWQSGQQGGWDVDQAADLGGIVRANWGAFSFPNA